MPPHEKKSSHQQESNHEDEYSIISDIEQGTTETISRSSEAVKRLNDSTIKKVEHDQKESQKTELILFGKDLTHYNSRTQFVICVAGVFFFTIIYGYLQELITVQIAGRNFGVFLASVQFAGYSFWSLFLDSLRPENRLSMKKGKPLRYLKAFIEHTLPFSLSLSLSMLKALDLGLTYLALQYINYPAKTLIKSSRVVFTMFLGIVISGKSYSRREYINVFLLVIGLLIFLKADAKSSAVFHPIGVLMLAGALLCDGLLSNYSEYAMNKYKVGHDAFQLHISTIASLALGIAAFAKGELIEGFKFFMVPGTFEEVANGSTPSLTVQEKILVIILFSSFGLFGASCAGAITKTFGAFYMSLTTTSRKALSLMISFIVFPNTCTFQHALGIAIFMCALIRKSWKSKGVSI